MPDSLPPESIMIGGWFGNDGQSNPDEQPLTDGWFGGPMSQQDLEDLLNSLIAQLITHKPIYINVDGDLEELKLLF